MVTTPTEHERRELNDGIESAFIAAAGYTAAIKTHYQTGRGTIRDLYEDFYFNLAVLFELTADLGEMRTEQVVVETVERWLEKADIDIGTREFKEHCFDGISAFKGYKRALSNCGLLSLPTGGN